MKEVYIHEVKNPSMKKLIFLLLIAVAFGSCKTLQNISKSDSSTSVSIDSTEYQITIIDPGFDQWYTMRYSPAKELSNDIYRSKNTFAVNNWNAYFTQGRYSRVINSYIQYIYSTDYGIEVNRKLYWYFVYINETFHIPLFL